MAWPLPVSTQPADFQVADFFQYGGFSNPSLSNSTSSNLTAKPYPNANTSPQPPTAPFRPDHSWQAPGNNGTGPKQQPAPDTLTDALKRAAVAERKAADHLQAKDSAERQLRDHRATLENLFTSNQRLTAENQKLKDELQKLEKHAKNCEKATGKAQKDAKHAQGYADHLIKSQKGNLISAERRAADAARELKLWRDRYGWSVEGPAADMAALQEGLAEWQSKADKAQYEVAALKGDFLGEQNSIKVEKDQRDTETERMQGSTKAEKNQTSVKPEEKQSIADALAKATRYKAQRDLLHRMLHEEMADNTKLVEWQVLRNAKLAESLEGWGADDGQA